MTSRQNLTNLPLVSNPNSGTTYIVVQDSSLAGVITAQQAIELLVGSVPAGPVGSRGVQGVIGNIGVQGLQGTQAA